MANHGVGTKYSSVNLNKSYGQQPHHHYNHSGAYGTTRGRVGGYGSGGGGGNMLVLSRPRSSQKGGSKLSVPPPLNLPSLRKEHERIDSSGSGVHSGGGISGGGTRPASSGMGWSKPAVLLEKERLDGDIVSNAAEGVSKGANGRYIPPVARAGAAEPLERAFPPVERAATLRGEDFPSLKATLHAASVSGQKHKEALNKKTKQAASEELSKEPRSVSSMNSSLMDVRPQLQSVHKRDDIELSESPSFVDGPRPSEQARKGYFTGPLPLVRLNPKSDWADDERDTSHVLRNRDRDRGYSKNEPLWDRDFDVPRQSILPHKPAAHNLFPGHREIDNGKSSLAQVRPASGGREANTWRNPSPLQNEVGSDRNVGGARPSSWGRELVKENKYISSPSRDNAWSNTGMRENSYQLGGRQLWNNGNRGNFTKDGYRVEHDNRDKGLFLKSNKPQQEDPFMKDFGDAGFDLNDPFPLLGVGKKKKEPLRPTDFHDPVRESFEAELEQVQKMQEEERRRAIAEQERAMELARVVEEERMRLAHEQEEQQRKAEEEAREAAWRTEQERLEASKRAEELKKSIEEEKHRILMEDERRKQAAKQKLLELEEKIAKRQAETANGCSSSLSVSEEKHIEIVKEKQLPRAADVVDWEDGEKMVERITTSSTMDHPISTRSFESNSESHFSRDGSPVFPDRQKASTWRKEDMENVPWSPQRDTDVFPKKESFGTEGYMTGRSYLKPDQSWRIPGEGRLYARNGGFESEFREGFGEQYGDHGWGQGLSRSHGNSYSSYPEKLYQNPEGDDHYPFGRPRFPVRQPRVLPPPMASIQNSSFRSEVDAPPKPLERGGPAYNYPDRTGSISHDNSNEHHRFNSKIAGRCDSQSSLSVSSAPKSPVHLSHDDDLDGSGDSSVLAGSRKDKDAGSLEEEGEPFTSADAGKDSLSIAIDSVSSGDDEEWTPDNNEHLQEQEEYDADDDVYREEDEIHAGDENIDLAQEFEDMHLQEKDSNLVLGFNEGVEVEIPSDDFEKCQRNNDAAFTPPQNANDLLDGKRSNETSSSSMQTTGTVEVPNQGNGNNSSGGFAEADSGRQPWQLSESADKTEPLNNSAMYAQPAMPGQTNVAASGQTEEPLKLQFGLFSGPSLIPSPVPTIQIGSIQMPLPLHPQFVSSLTHVQQPQPTTIFQYGQLRYTSPISQGFLPLPSHSIIQPGASSTFALNHNSGPPVAYQLGKVDSTNTALSFSDPQPNVLARQVGNSAGHILKSENVGPTRVSNETVMSSQKQGALHDNSESNSRVSINGKSNSVDRQSECPVLDGTTAQISVSKDKDASGLKPHGHTYGGRGKRDAFAVKNPGLRLSGNPEVSRADSSGYRRYRHQRVEFRVRDPNRLSSKDNIHADGMATQNLNRNGDRKFIVSNKSMKGSSSGSSVPQQTDTGSRSEISGPTNLKRSIISEKEIDVPLQSGIVRVFEQPGIEAPSDDDDFIEVRSKRQMLNDRREQREKEIKAKSNATKVPRKPRATFQKTAVTDRSGKTLSSSGVANNKRSNHVANKQPIAPIGTPANRADGHGDAISGTIKSVQASAAHVVSRSEQNPATSFIFNNKNKVLDNIQTSVGGWVNPQSEQPVMALTQSQLDEAMKPVSFDSFVSVNDHANSASEPNTASTSVLPKNNAFPIGTSPINSLLSGGEIQFGAITSSTVLPPCGQTENDCSSFFETDKHLNPSSDHMEVCEAEAAASAIAVAAITSDEIGGNPSGPGVESRIFRKSELDGPGNGNVGEQPSESKAEMSLSVSLPSDLSVDTPPMPLWPPLPSPHNSGNPIMTHFPPGPPHFPFYDMNHMFRGPVFAYGPRGESVSNQSQSHKGNGAVSGPPVTWQQRQSCGDSFYAPPPAGFTGPFLSPPGVQAPPHMFVYNHFSPVGQFGQVGLGYMGATYMPPPGKQPDWKHNTSISSSAPIRADADTSMQCSHVAVVPTSVPHVSPPSPLLPMFDVSPFQSTQGVAIQPQWPRMPAPPLHPMPLQQQPQPDGQHLSSHYNNMVMPPSHDRYHGIQTSGISDSTVGQLPDVLGLGLVDTSNPYSSGAPPPQKATSCFPATMTEASKTSSISNASQQKNTSLYQGSSSGRGSTHKVNNKNSSGSGSGSEWPHHHHQQHHRRSGRNQSMGGEKSYSNPKVKQIYVAKQTAKRPASASNTTTDNPSPSS